MKNLLLLVGLSLAFFIGACSTPNDIGDGALDVTGNTIGGAADVGGSALDTAKTAGGAAADVGGNAVSTAGDVLR
mgnify:CR=1 FL=1